MRIYSDPSELYHHGILGQKWGKRNGPPYPIKPGDHSSSERKAGWKNSLAKSKSEDDNKLKNFLNSKAFKVGLGVAVTAAVTYGAYRYGKAHLIRGKKFDMLLKEAYDELDKQLDIEQMKTMGLSAKDIKETRLIYRAQVKSAFDAVKENYKNLKNNFESLDEVPKAAKNYADDFFKSDADDAYKVLTTGINHGVDETTISQDLFIGGGRHMNCTMCSSAMAMRLKGYDVSAAETRFGIFAYKQEKWFEGSKFIKPKLDDGKDLYDYLLSHGEGHYGFMNVCLPGGTHSIFYTVKNGAVEIMDGQMNKSYGKTAKDLQENLFKLCDLRKTEVCDVTNCKPTEKVLKAITKSYDVEAAKAAKRIEAAAQEKHERIKSFIRRECLPQPKHGPDIIDMNKQELEKYKANLLRMKWADKKDLDSIFTILEAMLE